MRSTLPIIALAAGLALAGCAALTEQQQQTLDQSVPNPRAGAATLGPSGSSGFSNSTASGSASNAASGSSILRQEGPAGGAGIPR